MPRTASGATPVRGRGSLAGRRIVVTRARHQAGDLVDLLEARGARVVLYPTIRIAPPADPAPLENAAREAAGYDWIVFTSVNGVDAFLEARVRAGGGDSAGLESARLCAIGPATADALREAGLEVHVVPERYVAEAVLEALERADALAGRRILLPRAAEARPVLPDGLRERGARVDVVTAYRSLPVAEGADALRRKLDAGEVDLLTFTASSTVRNFHRALGASPGRARVVVIGPVTARTARRLGLPVHAEATEYTIPGLVEACERLVESESAAGPEEDR